MDELAHAAGKDPLKMRLEIVQHTPSIEVLKAVAEMSDWDAELPEGCAKGIAFLRSSGAATAQVVEVRNSDAGIEILNVYVAVDVGIAMDPRNIEAQVQSAVIFGLSAAIMGEITITDGSVDQGNFDQFPILRINRAPTIKVRFIESGERVFGVGEAGTPTSAPALGNAIFAATRQRIRDLPFNKSIRFS